MRAKKAWMPQQLFLLANPTLKVWICRQLVTNSIENGEKKNELIIFFSLLLLY